MRRNFARIQINHSVRFCTRPKAKNSLGTYSFNIPRDISPGKYTFAWLWAFNGQQDYYSTCFDVEVVSDAASRWARNNTHSTGFLKIFEGDLPSEVIERFLGPLYSIEVTSVKSSFFVGNHHFYSTNFSNVYFKLYFTVYFQTAKTECTRSKRLLVTVRFITYFGRGRR